MTVKEPPEWSRLSTAEKELRRKKGRGRLHFEAEERRAKVIRAIADGQSISDACAAAGVSVHTYKEWRRLHKDFAAQIDKIRLPRTHAFMQMTAAERMAEDSRAAARFNLIEDRWKWFRHETPIFQAEICEAIEALAPGMILMVLLPPEHGKTTLLEDRATLRIATDPLVRFHVGSETQALARKILGKIKNRLDPPPGHHMWEFVRTFGPFSPPAAGDAARRLTQPWRENYFNTYQRVLSGSDERDYTMAALGFGSQIVGSRSDELWADDMQSMRTLKMTEDRGPILIQDWQSRPGQSGIMYVVGNRVDNGDLYEYLEDHVPAEMLKIIRYPAILVEDGHEVPLWPERWTMRKLERQRKLLSAIDPAIWDRNWMQRPRAKKGMTFTKDMLEELRNPLLSIDHPIPGHACFIGVDPALGGRNVTSAWAVTSERKLRMVGMSINDRFARNEQIIDDIDRMAVSVQMRGGWVQDCVIESKNFQAGLARDERLLEMVRHHGFTISEHMTGMDKYDENVGIASMAGSFRRGFIELPYADDASRMATDALEADCLRWVPYVKGNRLRQDVLMSTWFVWIRWRNLGGGLFDPQKSQSINIGGLPFAQRPNGLLVPRPPALTRPAPLVKAVPA